MEKIISIMKVSIPFNLFPDPYPDKGADVVKYGQELRARLDRQRNSHLTSRVMNEVENCPCFNCRERNTCEEECDEFNRYYRKPA